jgi:mono/diheme cytochrome c family protein
MRDRGENHQRNWSAGTIRRPQAGAMAVFVAALVLFRVLTMAAGPSGEQAPSKPAQDPMVTPVAGPSWLNQLGLRYDETTLGRSATTLGPPPGAPPVKPTPLPLEIGKPVVLGGADLFRLNCQACHRAEGTGSPPEIKSVLGAVQGASLELVRRRMTQEGKSGAAAARAQAARARTDLHNRVQRGGQRMPPLAHLDEADFVALYAYLAQLAGSPDAPPQSRRTVSWSRLGEHVIKGTCHICHDAVGSRPTAQAMAQGTVPAFTMLLEDKPVVDFVTKVRSGAAVRVGDPVFHYRGRMPVFSYLRDLEVAAGYVFLVDYPPQAGTTKSR